MRKHTYGYGVVVAVQDDKPVSAKLADHSPVLHVEAAAEQDGRPVFVLREYEVGLQHFASLFCADWRTAEFVIAAIREKIAGDTARRMVGV